MAYTQRRLKETLRVFRRAKAAERRQQERDCPLFDRSLRNKHAIRGYEQQTAGPQATRWHREDSADEEDDDDYDPSLKRQSKKHAERAVRSKRKAADTGDETKEKKRAKTLTLVRASTLEELSSKISFVTFKLTSDKGKDQLQMLSERHDTGLRCRKVSGSNRILGDASKDTWAWEQERRKTYEQQFYEQSEEIDNIGGRALRNRKVPAIVTGLKKANRQVQDDEEAESEEVQLLAEQEQGNLNDPTSMEHGLPSPALTPPESMFPSSQNHCRQKTPPKEVIAISPSPSPIPECRPQHFMTSWAHPIDFQYTIQPGDPPCHFCSDFRYGLRALPPRRVTVKKTGSANKMYDELVNGHRNNNKEATRMCVKCALDRIYISNCAKHELQVLPGIDPFKPKLPAELYRPVVYQIVNGKGIEDNQPVHPVCSLCLSPALYRCCTPQAKDMWGRRATAGKNLTGCGLLACVDCEQMLHQHHGILKMHFVRESCCKVNVHGKERSIRADLEFLFRRSLLHQAYGRM